jgi:phage terminase small subunit
MTDKQRKFADEYLIDCNATRAYKAAYSKIKSDEAARVNGSKLLTNTNIKAYIEEQLEKMHNEKIADATEVMMYLTAVMRGEHTEEVVVVEGYGEGCSSATKVKKDVGAKDRLKAAELIGKRFGIFTDKMKVDVEPVVIVNDLKE